jgi:hypothetical protein
MDFVYGPNVALSGLDINFVSTSLPTNTVAPVISGTPQVRDTLTTNNGSWNPGVPAPITNYSYQWQSSNANIVSATSNAYTIPYTQAGNPIRSSVTATNATGSTIAFSNNTINVLANVPLPPTSVVASNYNLTTASVTFTPSADTGGATVTSYVVTSSPGSITASGSGTTILVPGLTTGIEYTFTVRAVNSVGSSISSGASNALTIIPNIGEYFNGGYFLSDNGSTYTVVGPVANQTGPAQGVDILNAYFASTINGYTGWDSGTLANWNDAYTNKAVFASIGQGFGTLVYWTGVEVIPFTSNLMYYQVISNGTQGTAYKYSASPFNGPLYYGRPFRTAAW